MSEADSEPSETAPGSADDRLVMAMPRKELYRFTGFTTAIDMVILESLAEDSWYAMASTLINNFDAKEVRLGLVIERQDEVLIDAHGNLMHPTQVGPEISQLGTGLKALRDFAALATAHFLGVERARAEMVGYVNDDSLPEHRHAFYLVYRCRAPDGVVTPAGASWVRRKDLGSTPLDPLSVEVAGGLFPSAESTPSG